LILEHRHDLTAFREAVRTWARKTAPPDESRVWLEAKGAERVEIQKWWMAERRQVGLATPHWPEEYGGAGLSLVHQVIIADEFARGKTPGDEVFVIGLNHLPSTLIPFGTEAQKKKYLPTVSQGTVWCQAFSEPNAGSDLANLKTRAVLQGDHYVINGQKIWSSRSMFARYAILLARTDSEAKKQRGITYFILDMQAPGIEVRPIRKSTGHSDFAELFLTNVRIPVEDRVGEENQGWTVAQATLSSERGVLAFEFVEREHAFLMDFYGEALADEAAWLEEPELRREFMRIFADLQAVRRQIRDLLRESHDTGGWSMTPALVKLTRTILMQEFAEFRMRIDEDQSQVVVQRYRAPMYDYLESFGHTIAAGTNEVMRNLIAERGLGMPR